MGHKCYIRKDSRGATLSETYANLATGMAADFDRLTGFMEAERPCTRRTENNDGSLLYRGWLDELGRPLSGDEGHIFLLGPAVRAPTLPIKDCLQWDSAWHKLALLKKANWFSFFSYRCRSRLENN